MSSSESVAKCSTARRLMSALSLLLCGLCYASSWAEGLVASPEAGWPQWRGPRRDGISPATGLAKSWPEEGPRLLWKKTGLGVGWSSPILVDERLYITGDVNEELVVFALDLSGRELWRTPNGKSWTGSYPGARASCCYSAGCIYHLNAHGRLVCLEAASGATQWTVDVLDRFEGENITWALSENVLVDGPHVIVTPGGARGLMAALNKTSGETIWTTPALPEERTSHSSPVLFEYAGRRILASCSAAHGFAVDAETGALLWTVPLKNPHGVNVSTPIYEDGRIYFVTPYSEDGRLYQLHQDGSQLGVTEAWRCPLDTVTGGGVLIDGVLYSAGYRRDKWWRGVDWRTGATTCELKELTTGAATYADGRLYCLDEKGRAGLVALGSGGMRLVGSFPLVTDRVSDAWAHPVVLDGRLYLRYHDGLFCYDVAE